MPPKIWSNHLSSHQLTVTNYYHYFVQTGRDIFQCFQSEPMAKYTYVILHGLLGGVELLVVRAAARLMNESAVGDGRRGGGKYKDGGGGMWEGGSESGRAMDEGKLATVTHWLLHCPFVIHTQTHSPWPIWRPIQTEKHHTRKTKLEKKNAVLDKVEQTVDVAQLLSGDKGTKHHVAPTQQRISQHQSGAGRMTRVFIKSAPCSLSAEKKQNKAQQVTEHSQCRLIVVI